MSLHPKTSADPKSDMVEVHITATEKIDHSRKVFIQLRDFEKYGAMVERHQKKRIPDSEWESAFGDYLIGVDGYEGSSRGLEDLTIDAIFRPKT